MASDPHLFSHNGAQVLGLSLNHVLKKLKDVERDLDVVELFSGVGNIHRAALAQGLRSSEFDMERDPGFTDIPGALCEDI